LHCVRGDTNTLKQIFKQKPFTMIKYISGSGDTYLRKIDPPYDIYFSCHWEAMAAINEKIHRLNSILSAERIGVKNGFDFENAVVALYFRYRGLVGSGTVSATEAFLCKLHATGAVEFAPQWGTLVECSRDPYFLKAPPPLPDTAVEKKVAILLCDSVVTENYVYYGRKSIATVNYTQHFYGGGDKTLTEGEAIELSLRRSKIAERVCSF